MPRKPASEPLPLPEFTSDRMRLLGPLVTPRAVELARSRFLDRKFRLVAEKRSFPTGDEEAVVKVALWLLLEMNARESLTDEEEGVLRGVSAETVGKRKSAKEILPSV